MTKQNLKYFLYVRKSTESEDRQILSIEAQLQEIHRIASAEKLEIIEIFKEHKSAKAPGRPIFSQMMKRIENGEA